MRTKIIIVSIQLYINLNKRMKYRKISRLNISYTVLSNLKEECLIQLVSDIYKGSVFLPCFPFINFKLVKTFY